MKKEFFAKFLRRGLVIFWVIIFCYIVIKPTSFLLCKQVINMELNGIIIVW